MEMNIRTENNVVYRNGIDPLTRGRGPLKHTFEDDGVVIIEKDVAIPMRDGVNLYCNIYRPSKSKAPAIVCFAPFGKDRKMNWAETFPGADVPVDKLSNETPFECFDTVNYAKDFGYAVVNVDIRGTWFSEGDPNYFAEIEGKDGYDIVEWLAAQEWCTGKVAWGGVSYLGMSAWMTAAQQPPHLACIVPWDAASDSYRECFFQGGIPMNPFITGWMDMTGVSTSKKVEDMTANSLLHPTFDEFWQPRVADWSKVKVPVYAATEWGNDLHLRGTIEAWKNISSEYKYLSIVTGKEWAAFYTPENQEHIREFLDCFLKDADNGVKEWPAVRYAVREGDEKHCEMRYAEDFPLPDTEYLTLYLDGETQSMTEEKPERISVQTYNSNITNDNIVYNIKFDRKVELCGYANARLWIRPHQVPDGDVFVTLEKIDAEGNRVPYVYSQMFDDGPMAHGFLRISHRKLDETRSTRYQPYHTHQDLEYATIYEPVLIEVEIWPTSAVIEAGESLQIRISGDFKYDVPEIIMSQHYKPSHSYGAYDIYSGGDYDSNLYLGVRPFQEGE